jgi:alpha-L-rhamnosidase
MGRSQLLSRFISCAAKCCPSLFFCTLVLLPRADATPSVPGKPGNLTCDFLSNPMGIDDASPLFSWQLEDSRFGSEQSAYQIQVASDPQSLAAGKADIWDSGRVASSQSVGVRYDGPWQTYARADVTTELRRDKNTLAVEITRYYLPDSSRKSDESQTPMNACLIVEFQDGSFLVLGSDSHWKASLNANSGWTAADFDDSQWVRAVVYPFTGSAMEGAVFGKPLPTEGVKILRRSFDVLKAVKSARLYATALGVYEFHLNGQRVGDQVLSPGWTDYRIQVPYQVYDLTHELARGKNALAAYLAPGWYSTPLMWARKGYNYGNTPPALRAQLRIEYADGAVEWIATDESWRAGDSPIVLAEIYDGETYDARREHPGWDTPNFQDADWQPAELVHPAEPAIVAQAFPPVRVEKVLDAKIVTRPKPGVAIYDFGQNLAGVAKLRVSGAAGQEVTLRFAEILNADGTLYTENLRTAKATDRFILSGNGIEEYQAHFTFHGFRYVELTGLEAPPSLAAVKAVVLHTDAPFTLQFHSGSSLINQLWNNILWGQRSNFISVPTDCPQRDERLGWTADAQVFWRTAAYNMDLAAFSQKFSADIRGTQSGTDMFGIFAPGTVTVSSSSAAGWSDAGIIIPWTAWSQYGDKRVIEQNWAAMERYVAAIQSANPDYLWKKDYGIPFGDWLAPQEHTSEELLATALWAYDVSLIRQMAHALGREEDAQKYAALFEKIRAAFNQAYVQPDGLVGAPDSTANSTDAPAVESAPGVRVDTQTGYVLALHMNLLPENLRAAASNKLVAKIAARQGTIGTGFLGTPALLETLTRTGHAEVAYRLLLNTAYPSWGYMIRQGATTMWERWNGNQKLDDPGMNSFNHYAYGAVGEWLYRFAAGIDFDPDDAGFHHILLHPTFDANLGTVEATYQSPYGPIQSSWTVSGNLTTWKTVIPPNTTALIFLPVKGKTSILVDGKELVQNQWLHLVRTETGTQVFAAQAGSYSFRLQN